jgi:hypothetical protein
MPTHDFGPGFRDGIERGFDGAIEELRLRYARGEMTREEYTQRFSDLGGDPTARGPASDPSAPDGT